MERNGLTESTGTQVLMWGLMELARTSRRIAQIKQEKKGICFDRQSFKKVFFYLSALLRMKVMGTSMP